MDTQQLNQPKSEENQRAAPLDSWTSELTRPQKLMLGKTQHIFISPPPKKKKNVRLISFGKRFPPKTICPADFLGDAGRARPCANRRFGPRRCVAPSKVRRWVHSISRSVCTAAWQMRVPGPRPAKPAKL